MPETLYVLNLNTGQWTTREVEDGYHACPKCGAHEDHAVESLRFPNRSKVGDDNGVWWWRCYNPECPVQYYDPETKQTEEAEGA